MIICVGLGNPGKEYAHTRHNIGARVVTELCHRLSEPASTVAFQPERKLFAQVARLRQPADVLCVRPTTYMNESGKAVAAVLKYHPVESLQQLYVCHDDLDLVLGTYKIQFGKGPKIHNGLSSIYDHLGTKEFWHVRVGVDSRAGDRSIPGKDYVLQPFLKEEEQIIEKVIEEVSEELVTQVVSSQVSVSVGEPARTKPSGFLTSQSLFQGYTLQDKGGHITQEFQDFGYRLCMALNDPAHKSLYMRLAKTQPRALLETALSFVEDAASAKSKAKLFMWKLKQLRAEQKKTTKV